MDAGREAAVGSDSGEQCGEGGALVLPEGGADLDVVSVAGLTDEAEQGAARVGQVQRVQPSVGRVAPALDQAALVQPVHQSDPPTRRSAEVAGQGLLWLSGGGGNRAEQ